MGNEAFREVVKPNLDAGHFTFVKIMSDGDARLHDGTNLSNEIGLWRLDDQQVIQKAYILQKVMLSSIKYHQRRKALTEMVSAWLDEGLGGSRIVPLTYAEIFKQTDTYVAVWGEKPKDPGRLRLCQVVHEYVEAVPGDEWRGKVYKYMGNLGKADHHCRAIIESNPDAERMALLDFLTINQDRSARNWVTNGERFYAIDNGMAWFHEYPDSDEWKLGCVVDDVILQKEPWQFISGIFTTSYAGRRLSPLLLGQLQAFDWGRFSANLDMSCDLLRLPALSGDWRFLGARRRLEWIRDKGRFPTAAEYRDWHQGSKLFTPPEIVASGGKVIWTMIEDKP